MADDTSDARPAPAGWTLEKVLDQHPGVFLSAAYFLLTAVGITYEFWLFRRFGINVLDYSETSDFLLAAVREPLVIVLSVLPIPILWAYLRLNAWLRRRSPRYDRYFGRYEDAWWTSGSKALTYPLFIFIYFLLFILLYTDHVAGRLKAGRGEVVNLELATGTAAPAGPSLLLGTTGKFVFLYYPRQRVTLIAPVENVARITVPVPARGAR